MVWKPKYLKVIVDIYFMGFLVVSSLWLHQSEAQITVIILLDLHTFYYRYDTYETGSQ